MRVFSVSSGAMSWTDPADGLHRGRAVRSPTGLGFTGIELSSLSEQQLSAVEAVLPEAEDLRVSVHAPALHRRLPEAELVERLVGFDVPVVVHPDVIADPEPWSALGALLLLENLDQRKGQARTVEEFGWWLDRLPQARVCLDVSHAVDVGGVATAVALAELCSDRVEQLHIGCGCGLPTDRTFSGELLTAYAQVLDRLPTAVPVVLERFVRNDDEALGLQLDQLVALS